MCLLPYFPWRWNHGRGNPVNGYYTNWYNGEPDLRGFDYEKRKYTPLKSSLVSSCTSNPAFDCYEHRNTRCSNRCLAPKVPNGAVCKGCGCNSKRKCKSSANPLFLDFRAVLENTDEALPACLAMYGPQIRSSLIMPQFGVEECSELFETSLTQTETTQDPYYLKWSDLKCNEKTRSQICTLQGKHTS